MNLIEILIVVFIILFSLVIHEVVHGLVACLLGDDTAKSEGRITLNPASHLDVYSSVIIPVVCIILRMPIFGGAKPVPVRKDKLKGAEWGMALVAIAGPISNIVMSFAAFAIFWRSNSSNDTIFTMVLVNFIRINLSLAVFNLMPIPPLDGSRVIYPIAPEFIQRFLDRVEDYGGILPLVAILIIPQFSQIIGFFQSEILRFFMAIL